MQLEFEWGDWIEPAQSRLFDSGQHMRIRWNCGTVTCDGMTKANFEPRHWHDGSIDAFAVPADHPFYLARAAGFEYWPGWHSRAPMGWDGGRVLLRSGNANGHGIEWRHDPFRKGEPQPSDIIGYKRKVGLPPVWDFDGPPQPAPAVEKAGDWAYTRVQQLRGQGGGTLSTLDAFALYIEAHEMPPVDPDVAAVRRILTTWNLNRDESVANQLLLGNFDDDGSFIAALDVYRGIKAGGQ